MKKRTKIVCTIGPASAKATMLASLIHVGMNVTRLNFSHGTHASHAKLVKLVRAAAKKSGEPIAILGDLQGPKIRLGVLPEAGVNLPTGSVVRFTTGSEAYRNTLIPVTHRGLHKDVKKGDRMLIDDGLIEVRITGVSGTTISGQVMNGGMVTSHKGMNFPDSTLRVSPITQKDREDILFGVQQGVDWLALSFVTRAQDVLTLRKLIKAAGKHGQVLPRIIVKIEKHEAIDHFDEILAVTDGVMVARGDLGVEIPAEEVPIRQKEIVEKCRLAGKPVVVATQMLDSMIRNPRPTRAEVSDVANAVFDHTDAVMLSGESATGKYPVQAAKIMGSIVARAEESPFDDTRPPVQPPSTAEQAIAYALKALAANRHIEAVLTSVEFAPWVESLLLAHPEIPLFLAAPTETQARQANIRWGVKPFVMKAGKASTFAHRALSVVRKHKWIHAGTQVAVVFGGVHGEGFEIMDA